MPAPSIDYLRAAMLKAQGLTYPEIAMQLGPGVKAVSIKRGMVRKGITKRAIESRQAVVKAAADTCETILNDRSKASRVTIADTIAKDVAYLSDAPAVQSDSEAYTRYSRLAPVLAAAERVYGWRADDSPQASISFSRLDLHLHSDVPETKPIEAESTVLPDSTPQAS